jgi:hypothetical protein
VRHGRRFRGGGFLAFSGREAGNGPAGTNVVRCRLGLRGCRLSGVLAGDEHMMCVGVGVDVAVDV